MKGYKVPQHMVEGRKNWIAQYQKDDKYAWGTSAVVEDIESLPLEELDGDWHTGTPTEDGWYLVQFNSKTSLLREFGAFNLDELLFYLKDEGFVKYATVKVVAWQKIEPFENTRERKK